MSSTTYHPFSVPRYASQTPGPKAREHLLVTQTGEAVSTSDLPLIHLALPDYADVAALHQALVDYLRDARVGLRLELRGDQAFVWPLHALARAAGLEDDEIHISSSAASTRRVFCVHCASCQAASAADTLTCVRCGVKLEVRRHFSQRLGAYLGVCADAEQPYAEVRP